MCVIITAQAGKPVPPEHFARAVKTNSDGWGAALRNRSTGKIRHLYRLKNESVFESIGRDEANEDLLFHARWATQGSVKIANIHPFLVDGVYCAHNGHLPDFAAIADFRGLDEVDSKVFFETLADIGSIRYYNSKWRKRVGAKATGQRLAFLGERGVFIANPALWTERDGVLYSNTGPLYETRYSYSTATVEGAVCGAGSQEVGSYQEWVQKAFMDADGGYYAPNYATTPRQSSLQSEIARLNEAPLPDEDPLDRDVPDNLAYKQFVEDNAPAGTEIVYDNDGTGYYKYASGEIVDVAGRVVYPADNKADDGWNPHGTGSAQAIANAATAIATGAVATLEKPATTAVIEESVSPTYATKYVGLSNELQDIVDAPTQAEKMIDGLYRILSRQEFKKQIDAIQSAGAKELADSIRDVIDAMERVQSERTIISG